MSSPLVAAGILPLADIPYDEQLARREESVRDTMRRGHINADVRPIVPSPLPVGSRARVKLRVGPGGALGFSLPGSHTFVEVPLDELARPEVVAAAAALRGALKAGEVEVRSDGTKVAIVLDSPAAVPGNVWSKGKVLSGHPRLRVLGLSVSPASFYQVNLEVNERIVHDVDQLLQELVPARLLDLYAGVGNLSARAVGRGIPATLVENEKSASADASYNLPAAEVLVQDAGRWVPGHRFFDVAVLDPPRAGAPGLLQKLLVTRPRAILYLSCDPVSLARDLRSVVSSGAAAGGYRVERLQPYDMFPGTDHVETLAVLMRT
ncbi:MAG: RsmD family RNA methyltransferase [Pseudomonadota bacterium]|nr:RsmD family RNA methyltransferase [Pseudomonadota bacterium]